MALDLEMQLKRTMVRTLIGASRVIISSRGRALLRSCTLWVAEKEQFLRLGEDASVIDVIEALAGSGVRRVAVFKGGKGAPPKDLHYVVGGQDVLFPSSLRCFLLISP